jgi:uncharacterized protein YdhG (YjbR/CyaY superfamily)
MIRETPPLEALLVAHATIDAYLADLPAERRAVLEQVRALVRDVAPASAEVISYGMPGAKLGGRLVLSYAAFAKHWSLFPASGAVLAELSDELAPYFKPTATLRFSWKEPVPADLVRRFVAIRVAEVAAGG